MKLKTILTLLAALGILTACNDDFFDQVPDDRITIEQVFQRTSYSEKYLATVYSYIRDESHRTDGVPGTRVRTTWTLPTTARITTPSR